MSKKHGITALPYMSKKKHGNNHSTLKKNSITTILCTKTRYYQNNIYKKIYVISIIHVQKACYFHGICKNTVLPRVRYYQDNI